MTDARDLSGSKINVGDDYRRNSRLNKVCDGAELQRTERLVKAFLLLSRGKVLFELQRIRRTQRTEQYYRGSLGDFTVRKKLFDLKLMTP